MKQAYSDKYTRRGTFKKVVDFALFPFRALTLIERDKWNLTSLASERFYYVSQETEAFCLDVGCGKHNRFIKEFRNGNGKGIDVFKYEGLTEEHIVEDISHFPFEDESFETVTFIANINHVPESMRDIELAEALRCLKKGGKIIITMGNPLAEILTHKVVWLYDRLLGTSYDVDNERGMDDEESYYLLDSEIKERLTKAGFTSIRKRYFVTQWLLNHMIIGYKK